MDILEQLESSPVKITDIVHALKEAHRRGDSFILITFAEVHQPDGNAAIEVDCHFDQPSTKEIAAKFLAVEAVENPLDGVIMH